MRSLTRWTIALVVTMGLGTFFMNSGVGKATEDKDVKGTVLKIADAFEESDAPGAKKFAESLQDEDLEDGIHLFKPRKDKRLGIRAKARAGKPDGIDLEVIALAMNEP